MIRSLLWGAICFGAGYMAATQLPSLTKDIRRYDRLRAMSDEPPIMGSVVGQLSSFAGMATKMLRGGNGDGKNPLSSLLSLIPGIGADVERYSRIRSM